MLVRVLTALLLILFLPAGACSEDALVPAANSRVRVTTLFPIGAGPRLGNGPTETEPLARNRASGRLVDLDPTALRLALEPAGGDTLELRMPEVIKLEVADGYKRHAGRGCVIGALCGLVLMVVAAAGSEEDPIDAPDAHMDSGWAALPMLGMMVGSAVGFFVKSERWREVPRSEWARRE